MKKHEINPLVIHLILLAVTISWGFNNIAMKIGFTHLSAPQFSGLRMALVFPCMIYAARFLPDHVPFERKDFFIIIAIGIVGMGLFQTLFPIGIDETSAPLGGILMATMPIHVVLLTLVFRLETPSLRAILGVVLTIGGLSIIIFSANTHEVVGQTTIRGILFVVLAEFGYAIHTTFLRPFMRKYPTMQVTGLAMSVSVIVYQIVFLPDMLRINFRAIHPIGYLTVIYSGIVALFVANLFWTFCVRKIGSTKVSVYGNLPPVVVLILSAILFGDLLEPLQILGSLIIFGGVVLVQLPSR